jgi:flagellar hook-associated protein 2
MTTSVSSNGSTFSVSGLSSGLDTKTIISQLMSIEGQPKLKMQWNQQLVQTRQAAWTDLNARLKTLKTSADALLTASTWDPASATSTATTYAATSTDSSRLSTTVSGTPTPGTYAVQVSQLAQGEVSKSTATGGTIAANDTLTITQGGTTWNVAVTAGDSFSDVAAKINAATGNSGVSASIDGGAIRLQSTGTTTGTGASSAFSISSSGGTAAALGFTETQSAQNALYYVDGAFHQSESNFNNAGITGVNLNLSGTMSGSVTVAQTDASGKTPQQLWEDSVVAKVKDFVSQYNSIQQVVYQKTQAESKVTTPANPTTGLTLSEYLTGPMARNTSFSDVASQLRTQVNGSVDGIAGADSMLASIGIKTGAYTAGAANGTLTIDETALRQALETDPTKVQNLFGQVGGTTGQLTGDDGIARRVTELTSAMMDPSGTVGSAINGATADNSRLQDSIDSATERLTRRQEYYEKMYAALEVALGKLQSQSSWLSSQLAGLSNNN